MKRILACAGIHGRDKALSWLQWLVARRRPDGVLFAGGVLDPQRQCVPYDGSLWGMTSQDAVFVERFFVALGKLGVFAVVIPGPQDTPLEEYLRLGMNAEVEFPGLHIAHGTLVEKENLAVCGVGGNLVENSIPEVDYCSRTMAEYWLRPLWTARQLQKVLLLPAPPTGPLGGSEGLPMINDFIDSYHPGLCIVAGTSATRGQERMTGTLVINPGCMADGYAAFVDWTQKADEQVEFLNRYPREELIAMETGVGD